MAGARFIGGDWGTTHLRLFLCDGAGVVLDSRTGPGAAEANGRFPSVLAAQTADWDARHGKLPTVLCGMVGSSIGWVQVPYLPCPARPEQIAEACTPLEGGRIHIVPGLSCRNRFDAPDLLRGEETQLLGALRLVESLSTGLRLLCLPGTHTKWVIVDNGRVSNFFTAPTGELFALLRDHSVLVRGPQGVDAASDADAFRRGLASIAEHSDAQILHRLFECRSRPLTDELAPSAASAYLSGLLIGSDVYGALRALAGAPAQREVVLIGAPQLTELYAAACTTFDCQTRQIDGVSAALAGLTEINNRPRAASGA